MATYYVGIGGNNANSGLTWALRKATLTGAEDIPVAANDIVYVAPGVYRELLTIDVSGGAGTPITYIGDVTGEHTDGIGGPVRITGSDDDLTATRTNCITGTSKNYRTFRGFKFDLTTAQQVLTITAADTWIVEDCVFVSNKTNVLLNIMQPQNCIIRRCMFIGGTASNAQVGLWHSATLDNSNNLIENCIFALTPIAYGVGITRVGGVTIKNCTFYGVARGVNIVIDPAAGQTINVYNCIFDLCGTALVGVVAGFMVEDYNSFHANTVDRTNVNVGANSDTRPSLLSMPIFIDGFRLPWTFGALSKWSTTARIAGTAESTDDLFGLTRPTTSAKISRGAIQYVGPAREVTTVDSGTASLKLSDAGEQFLMRIPVSNVSTVFTIRVYREADYAGNNPRLIVRQAGQSDNVATAVGAVSAWETLTVTCTPAADPEWVDIFVDSRNTAVAGDYDVFFDTFTVT